MTRRRSLRSTLIWLHRWIGLTIGLVFTVVSLSGSSLLFQERFWEWAHGELTPPGMSEQVGSIDSWIANGKAAVPELGNPIAVWPPHVEHNASKAGMMIFAGRKPGGLGNMGFAAVLVAPATGKVLGVVDVDSSPAYAPLFLHRDLWSGHTGQAISGIMAVGTLLLLVIGVYLWWPSPRLLAQKLTGRPWLRTLTRSRPMHDWVGVWTMPILLALTATGLYLVRPAWVMPVIDTVAGPETEPPSAQATCDGPITIDTAISRATALAPVSRFRSLYPTDGQFRHLEIALAANASRALHAQTHVVVDLQCGQVTIEATPETRSRHQAATMWMSDVHDGAAFGAAGPVLISLAGLSPLLLMWSGVRMWMRRRGWLRRAEPRAESGRRAGAALPSPDQAL